MKKLFAALCSVLPGGFILLGVMLLFTGCARFQYQTNDKNWIKGVTASPETVMMADAESAIRHAEAKCIEKNGMACYYGGWYGGGTLNMPAGYTVGAIQQPLGDNSSFTAIVRGQRETNIYLKALTGSQEKFQRALVKNKKTMKTTKKAKKGKR